MTDKYPVTLVFIDEISHYKESLTQIGVDQYIGTENFENYRDFENYIENFGNSDYLILLFIHVFRLDGLKGYNNPIKGQIKRKYPQIKIHWVTGDKPGETSDIIHEHNNTYKYDEIADYIDNGALKPIKIKDLKMRNGESKANNEEYIFLSHSSDDIDIVTSFVENILRLGLNVSRKNIFLSSHPSTGIPTGENIPDCLKEKLEKMTLFIQYVSDNYKKSEICLNEMGAAWYKLPKSKIITLKAPDLKFSDLGFLNVQRIGLSINKKEDLHKLFCDYNCLFNSNAADFYQKVDKFISENRFL